MGFASTSHALHLAGTPNCWDFRASRVVPTAGVVTSARIQQRKLTDTVTVGRTEYEAQREPPSSGLGERKQIAIFMGSRDWIADLG